MTPFFSVIIPSYDRICLLREALGSVWAQTFTRYEVIVIDDGSTDGTAEWLRSEPRVRLLRQANRGPGAARNLGAREASGEYVAFLDSDDVWFPWALDSFAQAINRYERPALIFGMPLESYDSNWVRPEAGMGAALECEYFSDYFASSERALFVGSGVCAVDRRQLVSAGGFAESLRSAEDIDLFLRLGADCGFVQIRKPHTLAYRRHAGGLTSNHHAAVAGVSFLIQGERAGRYPGGVARARQRREIITRSVRPVSIAAIRHVSLRAALRLYWETLDWHLSAWRIKYLAGFWAFVVAGLLTPRRFRAGDDVA